MAIDYSGLPLSKGVPRVLAEKAQKNAEEREWSRVCRTVDTRDKRVCQVTGASLVPGAVDAWKALERHHLELRSQNKGRRWTPWNVWTVARAIHQLIHARALLIFARDGRSAKDVREIDHVAWNRRLVAHGEEPCRIRQGLTVREVPL